MITEIELKAHVLDSEVLRSQLSEKGEYLETFEKDDTYWFPDSADFSTSGLYPYGLRVREEKRKLQNGTEESITLVTYKIKEQRNNIETNDEQEFEVKPRPLFEGFLRRMGLKPGAAKRKRGWAFSHGRIRAELTEVEDLGWFVEIEILVSDNREETIAKARQELLVFLDSLGVGRDALESRSYLQMLSELPKKRPSDDG